MRRWTLERELEDLHGFDIGIMPMPDTEWTRGKCGFKALLYMACGVPPVCSPVGMTTDIVQDGQNGLLATTTEEWIEKLSLLVENPELRRRMGEAGRATVEDRYSLTTHAPRFLETLQRTAELGRWRKRARARAGPPVDGAGGAELTPHPRPLRGATSASHVTRARGVRRAHAASLTR